MKKISVYLLIGALVFAGIAAYLGVRLNDALAENEFSRRVLAEQRAANREVYELDAKAKKLEEFNAAAIDERKRLVEENESLARSNEAARKDVEKMKLFADEAKKSAEKSDAEKSALAAQVNELDKKLQIERRRADGLSEELVELRADAEFLNLKKEVEVLKSRIADLEKRAREKEVELAKLNDELVLRERRIEALKNDPRIKRMEDELADAKTSLEELRRTNLNLRRRLARE